MFSPSTLQFKVISAWDELDFEEDSLEKVATFCGGLAFMNYLAVVDFKLP